MVTICAEVHAKQRAYDAKNVYIGHMVGAKLPTIFFDNNNYLSLIGVDGTEEDGYDNGVGSFLDSLYSALIHASTATLGIDKYGVLALTLDGAKHPIIYRVRNV